MNFYFKKLEKEKESAKNRHDMNARGVERFSNTFEDKGRRPHALRGPGARARARARAKYPEIFTRFLHLSPIIGAAQELLWPK